MSGIISRYHNNTSYSPGRMSVHGLDWDNQPSVYKDYPGINHIPLSRKTPVGMGSLSSIMKEKTLDGTVSKRVSVDDLSLFLRLTYTLTARISHPEGDFHYRSAASAGALYPTEVYVATREVEGLDDGLYHYAIHHHGLVPLRSGDLSGYISDAIHSPVKNAPTITIFLTAIFFRSAWKYRNRSYRYHLLDTGHVIENLLLGSKAFGLPCRLTYDFDDEQIDLLLGLNRTKEAALAVAHIPGLDPISEVKGQEINELSGEIRSASTVSRKEIDYPAIWEIHQAGETIIYPEKPGPEMILELGIMPGRWEKSPPSLTWPETVDYPDAVFIRRSERYFVKKSIAKDCFMALLDALCINDSSDPGMNPGYNRSICAGVFVGSVDGISSGLYMLDTLKGSIGHVIPGSFMDRMAYICLDQPWLADAAVHFLFLSNLDIIDRSWGARGYRYAMMTAGRMGEKLYVAATAMGIGCCGIGAFYDRNAANLIGLNDDSKLLYLVAVGPGE